MPTLQGAFTLNSPILSNDTSKLIAVRDPALTGSNGGVRFLFDTAFGFSYPSGAQATRLDPAAPADGAVVADIAEKANGTFAKAATQTIGYAGGGFDFSTMTTSVVAGNAERLNHVKGPSTVWAGIQAAQQYLVTTWIKLPTLADWNATATIFPIFASAVSGYQTEPDPVLIVLRTGGELEARRQTAINAQTPLLLTAANMAPHYGLLAQVAFWRTATATALQVRTTAGTVSISGAQGALNAADCSACTPRWGIPGPFTAFDQASHRTSRNFRLYRGGIENLALSGRDPVAVLAADWTATQARIAASAAANGGTSLIFV